MYTAADAYDLQIHPSLGRGFRSKLVLRRLSFALRVLSIFTLVGAKLYVGVAKQTLSNLVPIESPQADCLVKASGKNISAIWSHGD